LGVRLQGEAALALGDLAMASERLAHARTRAHAAALSEEELAAIVALAELHRRRGEPAAARDLLDHLWIPAERAPHRFLHADALVVLAAIERDAGARVAALAAAIRAYALAWCDGPPHAYASGLARAARILEELGARPPSLPPFQPGKYPPLPVVEIDPLVIP
jgi:tetratricopeptide (TPR) repeat protein